MQRQKPRDKCDVKKSVDELRKEIAHEQEWTRLQTKSKEQWASLLTDMKKKTDPDSSKDSEWRTRYYFQTLYNDMLRQQKAEMRAELRMMRHGQWSLRRGSNLDKMSEAECRKHVKSMELELKSLRGLCTTYDRQIDSEAMAYSAAHNESDAILNDVWFQEKMRIVEQENRDKAEIYARKQSQRRSPKGEIQEAHSTPTSTLWFTG
ncbi:hypothetical protein FSP39_013641 [Pinctada imbricata]|uniref:Uncharacterized protein n=1 Tax=Pinctada imbricata TaxID=66713 RepID=A0AA88XYR0_PINIB|nr:hypothetical protein FSP39_013641 [Pinctada imbricata]